MTTIRSATTSDLAAMTDSLASAFAEDPFLAWMSGVEPGAALESKMRIMFAKSLVVELRRSDHLVFTSEDRVGVAVWKHPNEWKSSTGDMFRVLPAMIRAFGLRSPRMVMALNTLEKEHPSAEHYFLEALGTSQKMQSRGVGSAVIGYTLERCDEEGMPAYLESSNLRNVPFYARHGFEVTGEIIAGKGAPPVTAMWREPR